MGGHKGGCIIIHQGYYLLVYQQGSGLWGFPKGSCRDREEPRRCAVRELFEETGMRLRYKQLGKHIVVDRQHYFMVCLKNRPRVRIDNSEITDYMWASVTDCRESRTGKTTHRVMDIVLPRMRADLQIVSEAHCF